MSRVGRSPVAISNNVQVSINDGNHIVVKGPKGTLERFFPEQNTVHFMVFVVHF